MALAMETRPAAYAVIIEQGKLLMTRWKDPQALPFCALRVVFRAHIVTGELRHEINGSSDTARWVPIAELDTIRYGTLIDEVASMMGYSNAASWAREYREFLADENARKLP